MCVLRKIGKVLLFAVLLSYARPGIEAAVVYEHDPNTVERHCPPSLIASTSVIPAASAWIIGIVFSILSILSAVGTASFMFKYIEVDKLDGPDLELAEAYRQEELGWIAVEQIDMELRNVAVHSS